jgi:hypothetical protein
MMKDLHYQLDVYDDDDDFGVTLLYKTSWYYLFLYTYTTFLPLSFFYIIIQ